MPPKCVGWILLFATLAVPPVSPRGILLTVDDAKIDQSKIHRATEFFCPPTRGSSASLTTGTWTGSSITRKQGPPSIGTSPLASPATLTKEGPPSVKSEIETAIHEPNVPCGKVEIFERIFHRSINTSEPEETEDDDGDFRILYGLDATPGEWPWIVRIELCRDGGCSFCTGSILNSRWILTAGHCGFNETSPESFRAYVGQYDLVVPDRSTRELSLDRIVVHPNYSELTNDLSLMRTSRPIQFDQFVGPVCLVEPAGSAGPAGALDYAGPARECWSLGYGLLADGAQPIKLQKLAVRAREPAQCNGDSFNNLELRPGTVCIGPRRARMGGSCRGDSGGPNQCYEPASNSWHLFGTVSYGPAECDRDADDQWLTVAVDLAGYRPWILATAVLAR